MLHILSLLATLMWKIITDCCCGRTYLHSVHRLYLLKRLKVPTSLHLIFTLFSSRAFKSPFTFIPCSHCGSLSLALLFSFISISSSLPPSPSFFSFFLPVSPFFNLCHVTPYARVAEGGLMASLSYVLAVVFLQLLVGYNGSTAWVSVAVFFSSSSFF